MDLDDDYRLVVGTLRVAARPKVAPDARQRRLKPKTDAPNPRRHQAPADRFPVLRQGFAYLTYLAYLAMLLPPFIMAQSFVGGELSRRGPYGLPAQDFAAALGSPASAVTFPIPGYNTSIPPADHAAKGTFDTIPGWSLIIGMTCNVPLSKASRADPVDNSLYVAAAGLSITPPVDVAEYSSTGWRVCAAVFTGGLSLSVRSRRAKRSGPVVTEAERERETDGSALTAAQCRVWPVVLAWMYFSQSGLVQDSAGWLSCATTCESKRPQRARSVWDPEDPIMNRVVDALLAWLFIVSAIMVW
ncbi:hypothetical protein B0I37DRAFT_192905 [Chaetomium sp. MPI-CAGE-AT-0009]|nr:hypothetical protein B0I37DRAFT_192905 [Chaetomium sp. MPI-CAGE-AT-0009]